MIPYFQSTIKDSTMCDDTKKCMICKDDEYKLFKLTCHTICENCLEQLLSSDYVYKLAKKTQDK